MVVAAVRAQNARIAAAYDAVPYDSEGKDYLDPQRLRAVGALYGCARPAIDVLDLGCGAGMQLSRVGEAARGRLVGVDISEAAVRTASRRCAGFGVRVDIRCVDFLDLTPADLGQFDLIYNVGVIYVTPPEVRAHVLSLIGRCLRPGGLAVVSYYAGALASLRAGLAATLRAVVGPAAPPREQIAEARRALAAIAGRTDIDPLARAAIEAAAADSDVVLYHEVFNHPPEPLTASALDRSLTDHGIGFVTCLPPGAHALRPTARGRAQDADLADVARGGYRYALFGKFAPEDQAPDPRRPALRWRTALRRPGPATYDGPAAFREPGRGLDVTVQVPATQALIDELALGPADWNPALRRALTRLPPPAADEAALADGVAADTLMLWRLGLVTPEVADEGPADALTAGP